MGGKESLAVHAYICQQYLFRLNRSCQVKALLYNQLNPLTNGFYNLFALQAEFCAVIYSQLLYTAKHYCIFVLKLSLWVFYPHAANVIYLIPIKSVQYHECSAVDYCTIAGFLIIRSSNKPYKNSILLVLRRVCESQLL
jgi:hypothetical protein